MTMAGMAQSRVLQLDHSDWRSSIPALAGGAEAGVLRLGYLKGISSTRTVVAAIDIPQGLSGELWMD